MVSRLLGRCSVQGLGFAVAGFWGLLCELQICRTGCSIVLRWALCIGPGLGSRAKKQLAKNSLVVSTLAVELF